MPTPTLSTTPLVHPTADARDCRLGAYCEVGARTQLLEVTLGDYSYIVNDSDAAYAAIGKFSSIAAMTGSIRAIIRCIAPANRISAIGPAHTSRARPTKRS